MFLNFTLVQFNAKAGFFVGADETTFFFDSESLAYYIIPPRHVRMHCFADDVAGLTESKLKRGGRADGALGIVWREGYAMCFCQSR
ncbi:uncharacterized protein METZ01_LOCUS404184, partial [marine metagenome]